MYGAVSVVIYYWHDQKICSCNNRYFFDCYCVIFVAFVGAMYSFYALYSSGEEAMLYGSIVTFLGWTLYGLVSPRFMNNITPCSNHGGKSYSHTPLLNHNSRP